ncbi:lipase family protein (plasmid) [Tistrella mobilis]|uniref:lipase family protein n=1 Tax=Tistrella mobilis TaxID=171437 RepID=UPI0009EEF8DD|nr:lipase family protein [Tistrella mobilis]
MVSIFDRFKIDPYKLPKVNNTHAHSVEIASVAVRIAAATYAFTHRSDPNSKAPIENERDIPFKSLRPYLASGGGVSDREWFGPEGGRDSFAISVSGGAAYGVLLQDFIFVGFRGTTNVADWSINLFGLGRTGLLKCPLQTEFYLRRYYYPMPRADVRVHAGFYRVSQALRRPVHDEIDKLQKKYRERHDKEPRIFLTGHSLGGALALLSGIWIEHEAVYTFGMPRVCEGDLVSELPPCHYRYELEGDPVTKVPFEWLGFRHDMPSLRLDPYRGLQKPGLIAKAIRGLKEGATLSGSIGAAAKTILASEHDMELYVETVMAQ